MQTGAITFADSLVNIVFVSRVLVRVSLRKSVGTQLLLLLRADIGGLASIVSSKRNDLMVFQFSCFM